MYKYIIIVSWKNHHPKKKVSLIHLLFDHDLIVVMSCEILPENKLFLMSGF